MKMKGRHLSPLLFLPPSRLRGLRVVRKASCSCLLILLSIAMLFTLGRALLPLFVAVLSVRAVDDDLPTLYEHYVGDGVNAGLEALPEGFQLNGQPIRLMSGAMHYFRIHPDYWRDRLRKLRACGLNAVETYVPWNLHNPEPGKFDFGTGGTDMSAFLDVVRFIQIAKEEDLLVLVRAGPYICAEWEFGGLPSWLLRDPNMEVRTSYTGYTSYVKAYYDQLLPLFKNLQFMNGGPIIAFQLENEYGSFGTVDKEYLNYLKSLYENHEIQGLFYTSDSPLSSGDRGALPGVLQTANFQSNTKAQLDSLKKLQPDKPFMVMEYWTGWFDHWTETHHTRPVDQYVSVLKEILDYPSSFNLYMFHGGTNWGFMNGANVQLFFPTYQPDVTSYDYDAPLTESGDYTDKYNATKALAAEYSAFALHLPDAPAESQKVAYPALPLSGQLSLNEIAEKVDPSDRVTSQEIIPMELTSINNGSGQSYGFILYRKAGVAVHPNSELQVVGRIRDVAVVLLDGVRQTETLVNKEQLKGFGYWEAKNATLTLANASTATQTLDILVENWGRNNFGQQKDFVQHKGIVSGPVILDGEQLNDWEISALQFKKDWLNSIQDWNPVTRSELTAPTLFQATLHVSEPHDTFLDMTGWGKGIVFVNGFTLGRYFHLGPPHTLYLPAPLLKQGENTILVFELFSAGSQLLFTDAAIL